MRMAETNQFGSN